MQTHVVCLLWACVCVHVGLHVFHALCVHVGLLLKLFLVLMTLPSCPLSVCRGGQ